MTKLPETGSALQKAIAILETIAADGHPIGVPDLAERLGLPRQSVHRILRQMVDEGLVRLGHSRERYDIGSRTESLSTKVLYNSYRRGSITAVLQQLVDKIDETCYIGVLQNHEVVHLERIETQNPLRLRMQEMGRGPAHASALGKLLIAMLPTDGRRRFLLSAPWAGYTPNTVTDRETMAAEIKRIRQQGYALSESEFVEGVVALAAPIPSPDGRVIAGIATNAPIARKTLTMIEECAPLLTEAATQISELLQLD